MANTDTPESFVPEEVLERPGVPEKLLVLCQSFHQSSMALSEGDMQVWATLSLVGARNILAVLLTQVDPREWDDFLKEFCVNVKRTASDQRSQPTVQ